MIRILFALLAVFALAACESTTAQQRESQVTNLVQTSFVARCKTTNNISVAQEMACKRAERINKRDLISCITIWSNNGQYLGFFPVNGKVEALTSYLLPGDRRDNGSSGVGDPITLESPDIDGMYGSNLENGFYFFTADTDTLVEFNGTYVWSDNCAIKPEIDPLLVSAK